MLAIWILLFTDKLEIETAVTCLESAKIITRSGNMSSYGNTKIIVNILPAIRFIFIELKMDWEFVNDRSSTENTKSCLYFFQLTCLEN